MDIDVSRFNTFWECPYLFQEKYENSLEKKPNDIVSALDFGGRMHELLEEHYKKLEPFSIYPPSEIEALETEAQSMLARYKAHYPLEPFKVVTVEVTFALPLPDTKHRVIGKQDVVFRDCTTEHLGIMDHKSQNRNSNSNHPKKWAAKMQASVYLWAARTLFPDEQVDNFYVNILTRQSPGGLIEATFPERQKLERTQEQIDKAIKDLATTADLIEMYREKFGTDPWPAATENCCKMNGWECDFYLPHTYGWSDEIRKTKYQPRTEYLQIGGVGEI